ncbi:MAG: DUF5317 family protein [Acidimicrobiales bacterium]
MGTVVAVLLVGFAVLVGLVVGRVIPPGPRHLAGLSARWWGLLPAGLALALLSTRLDGAPAVIVGVAGLGGLVAFTSGNLHLAGMGVLTLGLGLNLFAIVVNAGMPVRPEAMVSAGIVSQAEVDAGGIDLSGYRHMERPGERLAVLGDVVPLPFGRTVVSVGDIVVAVGAADVVAHLTRRRRRSERGPATPADLRHWIPPEEVAVAAVGGRDFGVDPIWRDDIELLDDDIDLGNSPPDPTDPDITVPLRVMRSRRNDRTSTR